MSGSQRLAGRNPIGSDAQISPKVIGDPNPERIAILFFDLVEAAKFESRSTGCLSLVESAHFVRLDLPIDVEAQLFIDIAIDGRPSEQRSKAKKNVA
jgi:hypothetical protein